MIGSHSAKRKKAEDDKPSEENLERLAKIEMEGNRFTLARVPLDDAANAGTRARRVDGGTSAGRRQREPAHRGVDDGPACRTIRPAGHCRTEPIEGIPSKDNGFDIEGLAVTGNRVFLGLRGPVLRGWASVIELQVSAAPDGALTLDTVGSSGQPYLKHLLQLDGLGVRELVIHGDDLLVLTGPSMDLDGPVFIYRWKDALNLRADSLTWKKDLTRVVTVPFGVTKDHAEGLSRRDRRSALSHGVLRLTRCHAHSRRRRQRRKGGHLRDHIVSRLNVEPDPQGLVDSCSNRNS